MRDARTVVDSLGGIATWQQLVRQGVEREAVSSAVRSGAIRRVRQGFYATSRANSSGVLAVRIGGRLAGPSAVVTWNLWGGFGCQLHVAVKSNASRLRTSLPPGQFVDTGRRSGDSTSVTADSTHLTAEAVRPTAGTSRRTDNTPQRTAHALGEEVVLHWGPLAPSEPHEECWRSSLLQSVRQTVMWSDRETAIACLDTAHRYANRAAIVGAFAHDRISTRRLVEESRPGSDSGVESLVRQRLAAIGIDLVQQIKIAGVGRVDAGIRGTRIILEIDGREFHDGPTAFENDRRRDAELAALGYTVIRLTYLQVTTNWAWCERMILSTLASGAA